MQTRARVEDLRYGDSMVPYIDPGGHPHPHIFFSSMAFLAQSDMRAGSHTQSLRIRGPHSVTNSNIRVPFSRGLFLDLGDLQRCKPENLVRHSEVFGSNLQDCPMVSPPLKASVSSEVIGTSKTKQPRKAIAKQLIMTSMFA